MSRQAREERAGEERHRRGQQGPLKKAGVAASTALFVACFAAGFGTAAVARRLERGGEAERRAQAEARFQKGVEAIDAERYSDAFEELTRAAELDPTDPRPHHGLGKIYDQLFLREKAERSYRKAIEVDPQYRPSKENLAKLLYEKGQHATAVAILEDLRKETPDEPFVWGELAINATAMGQPAKAIELLEKYNTIKGKQAWGYAHLGRAYADSGILAKAEAAYREAIAADKRFSLAYYWLGQLLVAMKRDAESKPLLETYRHLQQLNTEEHEAKMTLLGNPADVKALVGLARAHFLLGRPKESLATLERALRIAPGDVKIIELREKVARSLKGEP